jgi:hypothetical protein
VSTSALMVDTLGERLAKAGTTILTWIGQQMNSSCNNGITT